MNLLYNGQVLHEAELRLPFSNRAFQYNDGFFETIMIVNGKIRFWKDHLERMRSAAQVLKMELPDQFSKSAFEEQLLHLAESNQVADYGRLKIKIWRGGGGLYSPETNSIEWLATVQATTAPAGILENVGICTSVRTNFSPLSSFKGPNALLYVMASLEKQDRNYDDMILLSRQDLISELTSSNIFWYQQDTLYTPALETGCINGVMRHNILKWCLLEGIKTKEVYFDVDGVLQAEVVFSGNVSGIKEVLNLIGFKLDHGAPVINFLQQKIEEA